MVFQGVYPRAASNRHLGPTFWTSETLEVGEGPGICVVTTFQEILVLSNSGGTPCSWTLVSLKAIKKWSDSDMLDIELIELTDFL